MLKYTSKKVIDVDDWDNLIIETYGRPYSFQQQNGCQPKGVVNITIPTEYDNNEEMHNSIPEKVNGAEMGVKFDIWLARDPNQLLPTPDDDDYCIEMFYDRNFYPDLQTVANDLYKKGLIEAGEYVIEIDW